MNVLACATSSSWLNFTSLLIKSRFPLRSVMIYHLNYALIWRGELNLLCKIPVLGTYF